MRRLVDGWLVLGLLTLGCANHVRFVETPVEHESVTPVETRYTIRGPQDVVATADVRIQLIRTETLETRRERTVTRVEEYTPYQGVRELWEVPAGLVSLPLSFAFNLTDFVLFGYIPNDLVNAYTFWTFAALNPALNPESEQRRERRTLEERKESLGTKREVVETPLMDAALYAGLDDGEARELRTDANGNVTLHLLDLVAGDLAWPPRRVRLELRGDAATGELARSGFFLERGLAQRLRTAAPLLAVRDRVASSSAHRAAETQGGAAEIQDWPADDRAAEVQSGAAELQSGAAEIQDWAAAVHGLDQLGFRAMSAELHDLAFQRWASAPEQLRAFQEALDARYANDTGVDPLPASPTLDEGDAD